MAVEPRRELGPDLGSARTRRDTVQDSYSVIDDSRAVRSVIALC